MYKATIVLSSVIGLVFLAGCDTQQPTQSASTPVTESPAPTAVATSSSISLPIPANWKTYQNNQLNIKLQYPPNWKLNEYQDRTKNSIMAVALDPDTTISQTDFQTLDMPPGLITFLNVGSIKGMIGADSMAEKIIGDGITAKTSDITNTDNTSNPFYANKHEIYYYVNTGADQYTRISYVSDRADKYLHTFEQILNSLKLISI